MGVMIEHGQHHVEHYLQHLITYPQRGAAESRPPLFILTNVANNALRDAGHAESLPPLRFELFTAT